MPELPEVEHLRRSLDPVVVGAVVRSVHVARRDIVTTPKGTRRSTALETSLLVGTRIVATIRKGKQMALLAESGRVLVIQLGMTGSVTLEDGPPLSGMDGKHRHLVWELERTAPHGTLRTGILRMAFRDPRRFGGVTAYATQADLHEAWNRLGPDGLSVTADDLADRLKGSQRPIKAALLDQAVIAGVGNIYADESLYAASINPLCKSSQVDPSSAARLACEIRRILNQAADAGGSTLRDYRDAFGQPGDAVQLHAVYGRAGEPCLRCKEPLRGIRLQGRATVFCPRCQHLSTKSMSPARSLGQPKRAPKRGSR